MSTTHGKSVEHTALGQIAKIVCDHVPPTRFCDQGLTCPCWEEYALPAARAIMVVVKSREAAAERRGYEHAMEDAAEAAENWDDDVVGGYIAAAIRALPIPEKP